MLKWLKDKLNKKSEEVEESQIVSSNILDESPSNYQSIGISYTPYKWTTIYADGIKTHLPFEQEEEPRYNIYEEEAEMILFIWGYN